MILPLFKKPIKFSANQFRANQFSASQFSANQISIVFHFCREGKINSNKIDLISTFLRFVVCTSKINLAYSFSVLTFFLGIFCFSIYATQFGRFQASFF